MHVKFEKKLHLESSRVEWRPTALSSSLSPF